MKKRYPRKPTTPSPAGDEQGALVPSNQLPNRPAPGGLIQSPPASTAHFSVPSIYRDIETEIRLSHLSKVATLDIENLKVVLKDKQFLLDQKRSDKTPKHKLSDMPQNTRALRHPMMCLKQNTSGLRHPMMRLRQTMSRFLAPMKGAALGHGLSSPPSLLFHHPHSHPH